MKNILFFFLIEILFFNISFTQESVINVVSNIDGALIFLDTLYIGQTPIKNYKIKSGNYTLRGIRNEVSTWDKEIIETQLLSNPNDSLTINLTFRNALKIITEPENAKILLNNFTIGHSPLTVFFKSADTLTIEKNNYESESILLNTIKDNILTIKLRLKHTLVENQKVRISDNMKVKNIENNKTLYYLLGGGLALGTFAVIAKNKADRYEIDYDNKPSEDLKRRIKTYDTLSNISLVLFEACLLTLSYLLIKD